MSYSESSSLNESINSTSSEDYNFETYSLIWLDGSVHSDENIGMKNKLRSFIHYLKTFDNLDQCETYLQMTSSYDRIIFVVSGDLGQQLIEKIHSLQQIYSIYIYCANQQFHQQWTPQYQKIRGVHHQFDELINQIEFDYSERRQNKSDEPLSINIFDQNHTDEQSTTGLNGSFVQTQLLIASLLRMKTTSTDINEFIVDCRERYKDNPKQLKYVKEFEDDYDSDHSLWWYTRETFLYRLLNKAFRIQNIDLLFLFRFFIHDIEKELQERQHPSPIRIYRGQLMSMEELNQLKNSKNQFISITSFLSTSSNRQMALFYLGASAYDHLLQRVLFEIDADPHKDGIKPYADLSKISAFDAEEEFLMMAGSVFCLKNIYLGENQIWHIEMSLCGNYDAELHHVFSHLSNQYNLHNEELLLFGNLLIDMAHFDDAGKYLWRLSQQLPDEHMDIYKCYHGLGKVYCEKGNYDLSLDYLLKSLDILKKLFENNSLMGYIYNSLGETYQKKGDIQQAFQSYKKAMSIFETYNENPESIAWCYNNIGIVYEEQKMYYQARDYLLKALDIKKQLLPARHPCLGNTYNNLGNIHFHLGEYDQALNDYQLSNEIFKQSLTPRHPSIARTLKNIGIVYEVKQDFDKAKKAYEETAVLRTKILSPTHPDRIEIEQDIERVSLKMK